MVGIDQGNSSPHSSCQTLSVQLDPSRAPSHMMTGMVGLGLAIFHAISFISQSTSWNLAATTGIVSLATLLLLAVDGIGLMVSPFLSRTVHRWIALLFLVVTAIHLGIVL